MSESTIMIETLASSTLHRNRLGDPHIRKLALYLPPNYESSGKRFPVIFLLASFANTGLTFLNRVPWDETIQERMDRLINQGLCRSMILVMPDCFTRYGGSQYIDSPATGNYRSYLLEIVEYVDSHFQTIPDRMFRGIAGRSSGGYGAFMMAMDKPEVFSLVVDHSGDKFFEKCYAQDLLRLPYVVSKINLETFLADPYSVRPKASDFFTLMNIATLSACYSPNLESPLGFDFPVDLHTGEIIPEIWDKWKKKDPIELVHEHVEALRSMRLIYFDCGNRDEYYIHYGSRLLARRLDDLDISYTYEEFDGGHRHTQYRFDQSLQAMSAAFPSDGNTAIGNDE